MSGRGKGAKGLGAGGAKRHIKKVTGPKPVKTDIKRVARRAGVKRMSKSCFGDMFGALKEYLDKDLKVAATYAEHSKRKTLTAGDVVQAVKKRGKALYGVE